MKSLNITRKIDDLGRIVIPKELRKTMELTKDDPIEIFEGNNKIILKKCEIACVFCKDINADFRYKGKLVCEDCLNELKKYKN